MIVLCITDCIEAKKGKTYTVTGRLVCSGCSNVWYYLREVCRASKCPWLCGDCNTHMNLTEKGYFHKFFIPLDGEQWSVRYQDAMTNKNKDWIEAP